LLAGDSLLFEEDAGDGVAIKCLTIWNSRIETRGSGFAVRNPSLPNSPTLNP
jgi:hypothetical protein